VRSSSASLALLLLAAVSFADVAVTRDGVILEGELEVTPAAVMLGRTEVPRDDLYLVEKDDGTLVWAPDLPGRLRGYAYLAKLRRAEILAALVKQACYARAARLAREIFERAQADGLSGKAADKLKKRLETLEKQDLDPKERRAAEIRAEYEAGLALHARMLAERARLEKDRRTRLLILRAALLLDEKGKDARALLDKEAPGGFRLGDNRLWLDFHLDLEVAGAAVPDRDTPRIEGARRLWRRDLHEIEAPPIHMITPVKDTRTIGRCLAFGRLATGALATLFKTDKPVPRSTKAMVVLLYENEKEYISVSGTKRRIRIEDRASLALTAGYYYPSEGISRFYWSTKPYEERRIAATAVHELTHHWLDKLCPRYSDEDIKRRTAATPGYWIVEGFATLIEEGHYDVVTGKWDLFNSKSRSLDVVRALKVPKGELSWEVFYALNQMGFIGLDPKFKLKYVRRWAVGEQSISSRRYFYERAAATCQYLYHADNGKYRQALLDYVVAHYTGNTGKLLTGRAFGMSGKGLGQRVEKFANDVANGWRPR
jgi:hypothetical protein